MAYSGSIVPKKVPSPGPPSKHVLIADTGCTEHFCTPCLPVTNKTKATTPITIKNPNGSLMQSSHVASLDIPGLPAAASLAHMSTHSLLSVGQLCDAGCEAHFTKTSAEIIYDGKTVLAGARNTRDKLWHLELPSNDICANAATTNAGPAALVEFAHGALFSPPLSTLEQALRKGHLTNFPGLTLDLLRKYPPSSAATIKGHLDQSRKNQRSTKTSKDGPTDDLDDPFPAQLAITDDEHTNFCYAALLEPTGQAYTDLTGKFVSPSSNGNNYIVIMYHFDSNSIHAEPIRNRTGPSILEAYKKLHTKLSKAGLKPKLQRLDNECTEALKDYFREEKIDFQLVPPGVHRRNAAERAIRTFKNHFIAGLCSTDPNFPIHLWDRLLPQAVISLNLLRTSRINPKHSAWSQFNGPFDFNRTPIAPPGIRVLVHEKPSKRTTWSPHALDGWYVGPAIDSYRCYNVWLWDTRAERICDTLTWRPHKLAMPIPSTTDLIQASLTDIANALNNPSPAQPIAPLATQQTEALRLLTTILTGAPNAPAPPPEGTPTPAAPSPRVPTTDAPVLRVPTSDAPALRVADPTPPTPTPTHGLLPAPVTAPQPQVTTSPPPGLLSPPKEPTFADLTGPTGAKNRKSTRRRTPSAKAAALNAILQREEDTLNAIFQHALAAINPDTGAAAEYMELINCSDKEHWIRGAAKEFGRLAQGCTSQNMPTGSDTIRFVDIKTLPPGLKATYARIVSSYRPTKDDPYRIRLTVGGDRVEYEGDVSTKSADLATVKLLLNSVISTRNARFATIDIKDFYLNTPMDEKDYVYMRIPLTAIPQAIIDQYNLLAIARNGVVYVQVRKGMYGLKQAGRLANDQLTTFLAQYGYRPCSITPGLWKHDTKDITFTLVVDDFGVKYTDKRDFDHLVECLRKHYTISVDETGSKYLGLTINWDYSRKTCDISMPGYLERALARFQHPDPKKPEYSPHAWNAPEYGAKTQYAKEADMSPALNLKETKRVQEVLGTLLYYARAVDPTLLTAIGTLASQQANGTQQTMAGVTQLLNYCATYPDSTTRFIASDMILHIESDASYLSESKARSRAAGYHFLSRAPNPNPSANDPPPPSNGAITVLCSIMREVVSSAAEAELAGLFHNAKEACPLQIALTEMGHPQPATPIYCDNSTAVGIASDTVKQKRSKAIDMRFYWIRDRVRNGQFIIYWQKGSLNQADYFSKHHPTKHHQAIRSAYLHEPNSKNYFEVLREQKLDDDNEQAPPPSRTFLTNGNTASNYACGEGVLIAGAPGYTFPSRVRRTTDGRRDTV
jgi:Reverse transcriptase (RNA-dependent DNA polymerase)